MKVENSDQKMMNWRTFYYQQEIKRFKFNFLCENVNLFLFNISKLGKKILSSPRGKYFPLLMLNYSKRKKERHDVTSLLYYATKTFYHNLKKAERNFSFLRIFHSLKRIHLTMN